MRLRLGRRAGILLNPRSLTHDLSLNGSTDGGEMSSLGLLPPHCTQPHRSHLTDPTTAGFGSYFCQQSAFC
ncbi:uncharacterized [Tachysurus ichikawai]